MTNQQYGIYSVDTSREMYRRVMGQQFDQPALDMARNQTIHNLLYYVLLTADLEAADDPETGYAQASGQVIRYVQPIKADVLDMEQSTGLEARITVTNRFTSFSAKEGDLLLVIRNGSEWSPINVVAGGNQRHARITGCLGNGYYTARLSINPVFNIPSLSETGTGTYEGVGTGSAMFNECSPCSWLYGGTEEPVGTATLYAPVTCATLSQPSRTSVNGDGDEIYVYDPRKLVLESGAHVIVSDLGDRVLDPVDPTVGTGTGTAPQYVTLWMVLTGNYPLVAIPHEDWECCENIVYKTRCDHYITEGHFCPGPAAECPPVGTGSV